MPWKDLAKNALLGTENSSFKQDALEKFERLGLNPASEPSQLLANGAALLAQMRKAGFVLENFEGELPTSAEVSRTSPKLAHLVNLIFAGPHAPVLPEYFFLAKKYGSVLPTAALPSLMSLPDLPKIWSDIEPLLGEAGRWLLKQNPDWAARFAGPSNFDWQTGTRTERLSLIKFWRKESPSFALELLTSSWDAENAADKTAFLGLMEIGLSLEDEPLLERSLDDRRKEVRQAAAALLAKIQGSKLAQRMAKRTEACFQPINNSLKINILNEPDLAAQRDGILQVHPNWTGGAQAGQLGQLVSLVPPSHWESFFEKTPDEILDLFSKTDWCETLIRAVAEATVLSKNEVWAVAIFEFWQKNEALNVWQFPVVNQLPALISVGEMNRLALQFLRESSSLPTDSSPVFRLLKNSQAVLANELSLLIINRFRAEIVRDYRQIWQLQHLSGYLQIIGIRSEPALFDQMQTGWNNDTVQWRIWEKQVEDMLARLLFRRELHQELRGKD